MSSWIEFVPPNGSLQLFGIRLVGVNASNGKKLLLSLAIILVVISLNFVLHHLVRLIAGPRRKRITFWLRQAIRVLLAMMLVIGIVSIWFNDPGRMATAAGLVSAGLAFALQKVITSMAGYVVILRGKTFTVGDRITMGGVRGDVIALGFIQTTIMEMGQPPAVQNADPAMWVKARQYTGRIVTVTNDKIFDTPIYNYTREFPYIWEEITLPTPYTADGSQVEGILLEVARRHAVKPESIAKEDLDEIERRYRIERSDIAPKVYWRLTDNWLELTVRFITLAHGVRDVKDKMSRDILAALNKAKISVASGTYEIVGVPPLRIEGIPASHAEQNGR